MHIHEIIRKCRFRVPAMYGGSIDDTAEQRDRFLKTHPKQYISNTVSLPIYKIRYSYETVRGNQKEGEKFLFMNDCESEYESQIMAEGPFQTWVDMHNMQNPNKAISNVKILEVVKQADAIVELSA